MSPEELFAAMQSVDDILDYREGYKRMPFSYVGSKKESLDQILPRLPYLNTFCDVFGGSGVITLNRRSSPLDVYNDRFSAVTDFFKVVRSKDLRERLIDLIQLSPPSRQEFVECRDGFEAEEDIVERVRKWYISVQLSFAGRGLYFGRVVKGKGNEWRKIAESLDLFQEIADRFLKIQIENADWRHILKDYDSHATVFYLDPPYLGFNVYKNQMSKDEHKELCEKVFNLQGFVALSGYKNDLYDSYPWDSVHNWTVRDKMTSQALTTETSRNLGNDIKRESQEEYLYIKEVSE